MDSLQSIEQTCCEPNFTFIKLESNLPIKVYQCVNCSSEWVTCHCKKPCNLKYGEKDSIYFTCADGNCDFIVRRCSKCKKVCVVERAATTLNPCRLYWSCYNHSNTNFHGWMDTAVLKYTRIVDVYNPEYLCSISEYTEYRQFKKIIAFLISNDKVALSEINNVLNRKNYHHLNVDKLIKEINLTEFNGVNSSPSSRSQVLPREVVDLTRNNDSDDDQRHREVVDLTVTPTRNVFHSSTPKLNITSNNISQANDILVLNPNSPYPINENETFQILPSIKAEESSQNVRLNEILKSIKSLEISLSKETKDLKSFIEEKFKKTEESTNSLNEITKRLEGSMDGLNDRTGKLEGSMVGLNERTVILEGRMDYVKEYTDSTNERLSKLATLIENINNADVNKKRKRGMDKDDSNQNQKGNADGNVYKQKLRKNNTTYKYK